MIKRLVFSFSLFFVGFGTTYANSNDVNSLELTFVEGLVELLDGTMEYTRFRVVSNDAIIEVRNDTHLRFDVSSNYSAGTIQILAPIMAVTVKDGLIPDSYLKTYPISHYLTLKDQYEGKQPKPDGSKLLPPFSLADVKQLFNFSRKQWEDIFIPMASSIFPEGFDIRTSHYDTGTVLTAIRSDASFAYTFQPLFPDSGDGPEFFLITTWVTADFALAELTDEALERLETTWQTDLGPSFILKFRKVNRDQYVGLETLIGLAD